MSEMSETDKKINDFILKWCRPENIGHLLDTDDNDGERLRKEINNLIISAKISENSYWFDQFNGFQVAINPYMYEIFKYRIKELEKLKLE